MPAPDKIHDAVKNGLVKDGWTITEDPFTIVFEEVRLFADLGAERAIGAEQGNRRLVVESKSFLGLSPIHEFKLALGQYLLYQAFLEETSPDHELYLAVDSFTYQHFFQQRAIRFITQRYALALLVIDLEKEEVIQWLQ